GQHIRIEYGLARHRREGVHKAVDRRHEGGVVGQLARPFVPSRSVGSGGQKSVQEEEFWREDLSKHRLAARPSGRPSIMSAARVYERIRQTLTFRDGLAKQSSGRS